MDGNSDSDRRTPPGPTPADTEIAQLRQEILLLKKEIEMQDYVRAWQYLTPPPWPP